MRRTSSAFVPRIGAVRRAEDIRRACGVVTKQTLFGGTASHPNQLNLIVDGAIAWSRHAVHNTTIDAGITGAAVAAVYDARAAADVKTLLLSSQPPASPSSNVPLAAALPLMTGSPSMCIGLENYNEADQGPISNANVLAQHNALAAMRPAAWSSVPIVAPSYLNWNHAGVPDAVIPGAVYPNRHYYLNPQGAFDGAAVRNLEGLTDPLTGQTGTYLWGEFGYSNDTPGLGNNITYCPAEAAGIQITKALLYPFRVGSARTIQLMAMYQLIDEPEAFGTGPFPGTDHFERHFGLCRSDGTPKLAYTMVSRLLNLFKDTSPTARTFTPTPLAVNFTGSGLTHTVAQKSDGTYLIAIWQEEKAVTSDPTGSLGGVSGWNSGALSLPATVLSYVDWDRNFAQVDLVDIYTGATTTVGTNVHGYTFSAPAYVTVLKLIP